LLSRFWIALVPATSAAVLAGLLGHRNGIPRRPAAIVAGWAACSPQPGRSPAAPDWVPR